MKKIEEAMKLIGPGCVCEVNLGNILVLTGALKEAIEQHEQFRQEVSDAVRVLDEFIRGSEDYKRGSRTDGVHLADGRSVKFARFIITKPDPLVDAICHFSPWNITRQWEVEDYERFRAALAKRGLEIREKGE